jgi:hypothetical protein
MPGAQTDLSFEWRTLSRPHFPTLRTSLLSFRSDQHCFLVFRSFAPLPLAAVGRVVLAGWPCSAPVRVLNIRTAAAAAALFRGLGIDSAVPGVADVAPCSSRTARALI